MFLLLLIPFGLVWFTYRKWQFASEKRRFVWATFMACSLAWALMLISWLTMPLWYKPQ
jgi:hypothetical protein